MTQAQHFVADYNFCDRRDGAEIIARSGAIRTEGDGNGGTYLDFRDLSRAYAHPDKGAINMPDERYFEDEIEADAKLQALRERLGRIERDAA